MFFFEIMLLATPWMGFFFYFKDGSYYQGNFAWFGYVYIGYYFFMNLLLIFLGRARIETRIKVIVILYSIVAVLMVVLQYERKEMLTADFKDKRNCFNTSEGSIIPLLFPI